MTGTRIVSRTREAIRDALLARFSAYLKSTADQSPAIQRGDLEYLRANGLGVILSGAEQRAASAPAAILPDKAIGDSLRSHGRVLEVVPIAGETAHAYAQRVIAERQRRLGAGSPADWVAWAKEVPGIAEAYWYSRIAPSTTTSTLGTGCLIVLGPAQGTNPTNKRINPSAFGDVEPHISGTPQLRPVTMPTDIGNVGIELSNITTQDVAFSVRVLPSHEFPWQPYAGLAIVSSTTGTITVAGNYSSLAGLPMLANVGTSDARGGYVKATPATAVFGGVNTVFTFSTAFPVAPTGTVYPAPANWEALRDAVFAVFDALGPGDTTPSRRYPLVSVAGDPVLRINALGMAIMGCKGVLSTLITTPGVSVTPAAKTILELATLTITRT